MWSHVFGLLDSLVVRAHAYSGSLATALQRALIGIFLATSTCGHRSAGWEE